MKMTALPVLAACLLGTAPFSAASAQGAPAAAQAPAEAPFKLAPLPYAADALEPAIDARTMTIHHGKHHQAYVDNLNKAVAADASLQGLSLEQLVAKAGSMPAAVRNNAGGHWNHAFFWETMAPPTRTGPASPALTAAIEKAFGSFENFRQAFSKAGLGRFGSGWVWLVVDADGKLAIGTTPNQDNPLMDISEIKGTPLLGNDLWEHAYYLKHQNRRADYLSDWWQVVDWKIVSDRFAAATRAR